MLMIYRDRTARDAVNNVARDERRERKRQDARRAAAGRKNNKNKAAKA